MSDADLAWSREPDPDAETQLGPLYEAWHSPYLDYPMPATELAIQESYLPEESSSNKWPMVAAAASIAGVFGLGLGVASLINLPRPPAAPSVVVAAPAPPSAPPLVKAGPPPAPPTAAPAPVPTTKPSLTPLPDMPPVPGQNQGMSDDDFMVESLRASGLTIKNRAGVIKMGHDTCTYLGTHTRQQTIDDTYQSQEERWDKPSKEKVAVMVDTSMLAYCPQYVQTR